MAHNPDPRQPQEPEWRGPSIQGMIGATKYGFEAGFWSATIAVPLVAPEKVVYDVQLTGPGGYEWQAQVYPNGHIAADNPMVGLTPEPISGLQGTLHGEPGSATGIFFRENRESGLEVGIRSYNEELQARLVEMVDSDEVAMVWGVLVRGVEDHGDAQILVSRITGQETPTPEPGATPDATRLPDKPVTVVPTKTPTARPTAAVQPKTEIVEGWVGVVRVLPGGSSYQDYFDGQQPPRQYGIVGAMAPIDEQLANAAATGVQIRIYGVLELGVDDHEGGRIVVSHIERL